MKKKPIEIEIIKFGFTDDSGIRRATSFLNSHQSTFVFYILENHKFCNSLLQENNYFRTEELYKKMDELLIEVKGIHPFNIAIIEKRLDGEKWSNLFGSMETRNDRLTGKAITTTYQICDILKTIPMEIYYIFEFLSFSIRFLVGRGLIHDEDRGCLFHRKVIKSDIVDVIKSGYISLKRQKILNEFLEIEQIIEFKTLLAIIGEIARSDSPGVTFGNFLKKKRNEQFPLPYFKKNRVFISYSHKDTTWLERIHVHLKPFQKKEILDLWDDTKIKPGDFWRQAIESAINSAAVVILLVSADFLASDFITNNELPPILERVEKEGLIVLTVILKPCAFTESELEKFQSVNPPSKPVIAMTEYEQEKTFAELAKFTHKALEEL